MAYAAGIALAFIVVYFGRATALGSARLVAGVLSDVRRGRGRPAGVAIDAFAEAPGS